MPITLGSFTFDTAPVAVQETYEELGGRDARKIVLSGVFDDPSVPGGLDAQLDAVLAAASQDDTVPLSIRPGRVLHVRRAGFRREVMHGQAAAFTLELHAPDPHEVSDAETVVAWDVHESGAAIALANGGNLYAKPLVLVLAVARLVRPYIGDGVRSIAYTGAIEQGSLLSFDAAEGVVLLDGDDVTAYTTGLFPRIAPAGTTLRYTDDPESGHEAAVTVSYRERWW